MKKGILIAIISVVLFSCQQEKTAFVNNEKLIEEYQKRIDIEDKYKVLMEAYTKKKDSLRNAFKAEVASFQAQAKSMPADKTQEMYDMLGQKQQQIQQNEQIQERTRSQQSQGEIDGLLKTIDEAIVAYGEANGYSYIFGKNKVGSVQYGAEKNNITKIILDNLNKTYSEAK